MRQLLQTLDKKLFTYFIFIICSALLFGACENDVHAVRDLDTKKSNVEVGEGIIGYMSENGKVKAQLKTPYLTRSETDSAMTEFPKSLNVILFDSSTKADTHIFAKYGRYLERIGKIFLRDSVIIYTRNKDTIRTSQLTYDKNTNRIFTTKPAWIHRHLPQEEYVYAKGGLTANAQDFSVYTLYDAQAGSFLKYSESALAPGGMR